MMSVASHLQSYPRGAPLCQIDIAIDDARWQPHAAQIQAHGQYVWRTLRLPAGELSVLLSNDARLAALNAHYRHKMAATNILSFPALDFPVPFNPANHNTAHNVSFVLGDVALAFERIAAEAEARHLPFVHHVLHLLTHGILHLLGYTHSEARAAQAMERLEIDLLAQCGIANPYTIEVTK